MTYSHTMPIDIAGNEVQIEFEFTCSPLIPATWDDLAEGGEVEIDGATLLIEKHDKTIERVEAPNWLLGILGNDQNVIERLGESCDWARDDGSDPDYERDLRMER